MFACLLRLTHREKVKVYIVPTFKQVRYFNLFEIFYKVVDYKRAKITVTKRNYSTNFEIH